jgi:hypothetical protein
MCKYFDFEETIISTVEEGSTLKSAFSFIGLASQSPAQVPGGGTPVPFGDYKSLMTGSGHYRARPKRLPH